MAMTAAVKDELSRVEITKPCCRKAEVAATAAVRRRPAHRRRAHRRRGRARHRRRRAAAAQGHLRGLRPHQRRRRGRSPAACARARRYVVRVVDGRRVAGPPDRVWSTAAAARCAGCRPRSSPAAMCDARGRLARRLPGPRLAHRARPVVGAGDHLPRPGGRAGAGRCGPPAGHRRQGPRGARRRPGRDPRRRRHRRDAHPAGRPRVGAGVGGAPDAPRGAGHRQPPGQLRRRQPAPLGPGGGRRRRPGASAPWRSSATTCPTTSRRPAGCAWSTSRPSWRSSARWPTRR